MPEVYHKKSQEATQDPSNCSCEVCDSIDCFVKRNQNILRCTCGRCSETCIVFLPDQNNSEESNKKPIKFNKTNSYSGDVIKPKVKQVKSSKSNTQKSNNYCEDIIKSKVIFDQNCDVIASQVSKYSTRKFLGSKKSSTIGCASKFIKNNMCFDNQPGSIQSTSIPENSPTCVQSVMVNTVGKINSAAKLSAQIMNVPYTEFENSMSFQKHESESKLKLTKFDILDRIKKAYEACSCKICECIPSIPVVSYSERCDCKPCDCDDCRKLQLNFCSSDEYEQTQKQYVIKDKDRINKCGGCKNMLTPRSTNVIVAPVGESTQRGECTCSPCDCMECDHPYGTINTSGNTHEMSTGISRHRNCRCEACLDEACDTEASEVCRCEGRGRLMSKPVEKDTNDYDIRSALICKTKSMVKSGFEDLTKRQANICKEKNLATKPSEEVRVYISKKQEKKGILPLTSQNFNEITEMIKRSEFQRKSCDCKPCECGFCSMKSTNNAYVTNSENINCICKECDCLQCESKLIQNYDHLKQYCDCGKCDCIQCDKLINHKKGICDCEKCKRERIIEKFKKTRSNYNCIFLNQSKHTDKITIEDEQSLLHKMKPCATSKSAESLATYKSKFENMSYQTYRLHNKISCFDSALQKELKAKIKKYMLTKREDTSLAELKNGFKCESFVQCRNGGKIRYVNKFTDIHKTESFVSAVSDTSKESFINESSSTIQHSKNNTKCSNQSSCNSSGHDNSDYLILFPRTTVGSCIKDVMNLDLNSNINLENINISNKKFNPLFKKSGHYSLKPVNPPFCQEEYKTLRSKIPAIDYFQPSMEKSCKRNHSLKLCDCNVCDCERCSFTTFKQSSCQCACLACNCCGVCLNENQSISIKKNEEVQTPAKICHDKSEDCIDWRYVASKQKYKQYYKIETQMFPIIKRNNDFRFGQNIELIPLDNSWPVAEIHDNPYLPLNYYDIEHVCVETNVMEMKTPLEDNYKILRTLLKEARLVSNDLLGVLEKYEKANEEFRSVTQKPNEIKPLVEKSTTATSMHKIILCDVETCYDLMNFEKCATKNEACIQTKQNEDITDRENIETYGTDNAIHKAPRDLETISSYIMEEVCKKLCVNSKDKKFWDRYTKYRKLIKRAVRMANRFKANSPIQRNSPVSEISKYINHLTISAGEHIDVNAEVSNKADSKEVEECIPCEEKVITEKERIKSLKDDLIARHIKDIMLGKYKSSLIMGDEDIEKTERVVYKMNNENIYTVQMKELNCKLNMLNSEAAYLDNDETKCSSSIENTQSRQKCGLVNLKYVSSSNETFQPANFNLLFPNLEKKCKESNDNMKITFEQVQRVSDHTLLIRWCPPKVTEAIQGYELLVDGQAVQKLLGPSRSMAVVTCIPNSAKIHLTIRTITSKPFNNFASASIVYTPHCRYF